MVQVHVDGFAVKFVDRAEALKMIGSDNDRLRNYEIEYRLELEYDGRWVVSEWCPFDGRFCRLDEFVSYPHPPMNGELPKPPATDIPWNEFDPKQVPTQKQMDERSGTEGVRLALLKSWRDAR